MIITLGGKAGSGKTTFAKRLSEYLKYDYFYAGGLQREMAKKRGMTIEEYNALCETDASIDKEIEAKIEELGTTKDNIVIEGRTAAFFVPNSIKVFLDVDLKVGAERILKELQSGAKHRNEHIPSSTEEMMEKIQERQANEIRRYKEYYDIQNCHDPQHFDIVVDTTSITRDEVFEEVLRRLKKEYSLSAQV